MVLEKLQPAAVWDIFENLMAATPRPSKKEEKIRVAIKKWLSDKSKKSGIKLSVFEDETGNILIQKAASPGMESAPSVLLQGHMDMVTETDREDGYDFDNHGVPIRIQENGEWVDADGTTLGADDGIGVALSLALLYEDDKEFAHGPLEILITVDEETGLTGAFNLDVSILPIESKLLINVDSEQSGIITIGSAGGGDTTFAKKIKKINLNPTENYEFIQLKVSGLLGGHSGGEIHSPRANANKLIARLLGILQNKMDVFLIDWNGGTKHNAITRESIANIAIPKEKMSLLEKLMDEEIKVILSYYHNETYNGEVIEPNIKIDRTSIEPKSCFSVEESTLIISTANIIFQGVIKFSPVVKNLVETSNNVSIIKTTGDEISFHLSSRSNLDSELEYFRNSLYQLGKLGKWEIELHPAYPSWAPNPGSKFLQFVKKYYEEVYKKEIKVGAIHAGLETGIIGAKIPGMEMVSIGPTVKDLHTPNEKVYIKDVEMLYTLLKNILKDIGKFTY